MNRILNIFDDLGKQTDCQDATDAGRGIAGRFPNNRLDMNTLKIKTNLDQDGSELELCIGYLDDGYQNWTSWWIGCQNRLSVWFENGERVDFEQDKYDTEKEYKLAVYNYFQKYIATGFGGGSNLQIVQEVEFMDI